MGVQTARNWMFTRPALVEGQAARATEPQLDPELQAAVERAASSSRGAVGVYVWDLDSGASARIDEDRPFPAASLIKVPVLVEVLKQERLGRLSASERLTVERGHWADGAGVLQAKVGESFTVEHLAELMIVESDNIAARVLMDRVGVDNVNQSMAGLGLSRTHLQPLGEGGDARAPHTTSAHDMARLFGLIASGELLDIATSERALRLLERRQAQAWLAEGLPWWAKLAHKWGDLPSARHDAGVVFTPRGRYVVAVLTEGLEPGDAAATISRVSRAAFERLGEEPG